LNEYLTELISMVIEMKTNYIFVTVLLLLIIGTILISGCMSNSTGNRTNVSTCQTVGNETKFIAINPVNTTHYVGDVFEINGTTNFGIDTKIKLTFHEPRFDGPLPNPAIPTTPERYNYTDSDGYVKIQKGDCGVNFWSYIANLSGFHPKFGYSISVYDEPKLTIVNYTQSLHIESKISNGVDK
jgi:hypothetical protein